MGSLSTPNFKLFWQTVSEWFQLEVGNAKKCAIFFGTPCTLLTKFFVVLVQEIHVWVLFPEFCQYYWLHPKLAPNRLHFRASLSCNTGDMVRDGDGSDTREGPAGHGSMEPGCGDLEAIRTVRHNTHHYCHTFSCRTQFYKLFVTIEGMPK